MELTNDISGYDLGSVFLDVLNDEVIYCSTVQPRPNTKRNRDLDIDPEVLYDEGETIPSSKICLVDGFTVNYALVKQTISNDSLISKSIYDVADLPVEATLKLYIEKLKGNGKFLVIKL